MKKLNQRQALFASTMLCGAALVGATQANAQAAAAPAAAATVQEVVVTGSRIPRQNLESASPLTIVTSGEVKAEGVVNIETLINNLPSVVASQNSTVSNGSTGTATVSLRGLGSQRTLVLIDGRRLQAGDPGVPVPDLNFIPTPLVERVDVLTGGASSVYGADAVAGVVNFVMKRNFEGIQIDAQYGFDQHENGNQDAATFLAGNPFGTGTIPLKRPGDLVERNNSQVSIIMGANSPDNKGNVTAYAEYTNLQPILESSRDFSDCTITSTNTVSGGPKVQHICAGSSNNANGRFNPTGQYQLVPGTAIPVLSASGKKIAIKSQTNFNAPSGTFVPFSSAADFNYGPLNYFQRADDRYNLGAFGHYQVNEHMDVYMDTMFMDDHTIAQIAPSGFFQGPAYYIPCNNAFLSAAQATSIGCGTAFEGGVFAPNAAGTPTNLSPAGTPAGSVATTIGYRFLGSNRQDDLRHTDYRIVLGSKGDLGEGWSYDVYALYSEAIYNEHYLNDVSVTKLQNALNTVSKTQCVSGVGCVPINIFASGANTGITPAMLGYVLTPGFKSGFTQEQIVEANVTGDLGQYGLKSPFAKEGVKVNLGADYRREGLEETVDNEFSSGDLSGQGASTPPAKGSFNLYEVYTELQVPLISDMTFVKSLDFDGGYRYSNYSNIGQTTTYKLAMEYAPISDIKLRASFNHAVRAPNIDELYQPDTSGNYSGNDPCGGATPKATAAQCALSGVTAAQYGLIPLCPASQCNALTGGNPALRPEASDTTTIGIVFTPTFIKGFSATIDYYDIRVNGIIQGIPPTATVNDCILSGITSLCPLIHRDASGSLLFPNGFVISTDQNTGYLQTKGYDLEVNYRFKVADIGMGMFAAPDWGSVGINFVGTYTQNFIDQPVTGLAVYDCAGLYGPTCGNPDPHWRHKMRITWATPWNFDISGQWRYVGGVKLDSNEGNQLLNNGYVNIIDSHIAPVSYFDLSGNWRVKDGFTVRAGVNNILDKDPPIQGSVATQLPDGNGNTWPGVYDSLGRQFFVGLTAKF